MTTTYSGAKGEIFERLKSVVTASAPGIVGSIPNIRYIGHDEVSVPPVNQFFIEASLQTVSERQSGFGVETRLYTTRGNLFVKLFCPTTLPNARSIGERLAQAIKEGYRPRNSTGSVWYREARIQELPIDKGAYRLNVIATYTYDERS